MRTGKVEILADFNHGTVNASGSVDISAPDSIALRAYSMPANSQNGLKNTSQTADGGFVDTSAANVQIADSFRVNANAANGKTGNWLIDPNDYTIAASGGNITGAALGANLANANITISTATQGKAGGNGDIFVNDEVSWTVAKSLTLNAERHIDFRGGGVLNASNPGSSVTLTAGLGSSGQGAIIGGPGSAIVANSGTVVRAGTLVANAKTGIGSASQALNTQVGSAALTNTQSGGISILNRGDLTVAARSAQGDISIRTADSGSVVSGRNNITVDTVNGLAGITATGSGNILIAAGAGAESITTNSTGAQGAAGQAGGNVRINQSVSAAQGSITVRSGQGGQGGKGGSGAPGIDGRTYLEEQCTLVIFCKQVEVTVPGTFGGDAGNAGVGGAGGALVIDAGLNAANGDVILLSGAGGAGGSGGVGGAGGLRPNSSVRYTSGVGGDGAAGGTGGLITVNAAISANGQNLLVQSGAGGSGGGQGKYGDPTNSYFFGSPGNGGAGGNVQINSAIRGNGAVSLVTGSGGAAGPGAELFFGCCGRLSRHHQRHANQCECRLGCGCRWRFCKNAGNITLAAGKQSDGSYVDGFIVDLKTKNRHQRWLWQHHSAEQRHRQQLRVDRQRRDHARCPRRLLD
ncbi:MAG: hypothetical protein HC765_05790 [Brachymonas sp.]|nr:hypothetical protein [Brachymonas sp.]